MLPANTHGETTQEAQPESRTQRRLVAILVVVLAILLLTFIPPLINVGRFQLRIARNISAAIGRPVHFDRVALTVMPLPGLTLKNFVVDEDPAFGSEPILRAGEVHATLRLSSIWRRRVEFSNISLSAGDAEVAPSVNLVHLKDGRWNIESLLLRASHSEAAPTDQRYASHAPRFPYIEATGARVNLKLDQVKTPFSLTDADFSLWLPEPHQWHLRLESRLLRTDTNPGDTGTIRMEGTLGATSMRADSLAEVPIDLHGDWRDLQLGGLGTLLLGRDPGLRGDLSLSFSIQGTLGLGAIATQIDLRKTRRADFVADHLLSLSAGCTAFAKNTFQSFSSIECHWPPAESSDASVLILTGDLPDVGRPSSGTATVTFPALPSQTLIDWLSIATPHPPTGFAGTGTLAGTVTWRGQDAASSDAAARSPQSQPETTASEWSGDLEFSGESLKLPALGPEPVSLGDIELTSTQETAPPAHSAHAAKLPAPKPAAEQGFDLLPISLSLGGKQPMTLEGHFDASGYTLHLSGSAILARLSALGKAIPQFGDGLSALLPPRSYVAPPTPAATTATPRGRGRTAAAAEQPGTSTDDQPPVHFDITATRTWGGPQTWRETAQPAPAAHR